MVFDLFSRLVKNLAIQFCIYSAVWIRPYVQVWFKPVFGLATFCSTFLVHYRKALLKALPDKKLLYFGKILMAGKKLIQWAKSPNAAFIRRNFIKWSEIIPQWVKQVGKYHWEIKTQLHPYTVSKICLSVMNFEPLSGGYEICNTNFTFP